MLYDKEFKLTIGIEELKGHLDRNKLVRGKWILAEALGLASYQASWEISENSLCCMKFLKGDYIDHIESYHMPTLSEEVEEVKISSRIHMWSMSEMFDTLCPSQEWWCFFHEARKPITLCSFLQTSIEHSLGFKDTSFPIKWVATSTGPSITFDENVEWTDDSFIVRGDDNVLNWLLLNSEDIKLQLEDWTKFNDVCKNEALKLLDILHTEFLSLKKLCEWKLYLQDKEWWMMQMTTWETNEMEELELENFRILLEDQIFNCGPREDDWIRDKKTYMFYRITKNHTLQALAEIFEAAKSNNSIRSLFRSHDYHMGM